MTGTIETLDGKIIVVRFIIALEKSDNKYFAILLSSQKFEISEAQYTELKALLARV